MQKIILFDFDGTLADSYENFVGMVALLSKKYKFPSLTREQIEKLRSESARDLIKKFKIPLYKIPLVGIDMKRLQQEHIGSIKPFAGIKEMLEGLKTIYILGIVTSNGEENVRTFLKKNQLEYFDYIHTDTSIFGKSRVLSNFIKKYKCTKEQILYVGDEIRDIEACKKIGVKIASVSWGFNTKASLDKNSPDFILESPKDLLKIIF